MPKLFLHHVRTWWEGGHLHDRKKGLTRKQIDQDLHLELPSLENCEQINFCCLSSPVYGILLWWPEQIKTQGYHASWRSCLHLLINLIPIHSLFNHFSWPPLHRDCFNVPSSEQFLGAHLSVLFFLTLFLPLHFWTLISSASLHPFIPSSLPALLSACSGEASCHVEGSSVERSTWQRTEGPSCQQVLVRTWGISPIAQENWIPLATIWVK